VTSTPVALFLFNRPDLTARVFERVRAARPPAVFLFADGPRPGVPGEAELCAATRAEVEDVDWPCEVHRGYADDNVGVWDWIGGGLDRVFDAVERAVVLEDDCLPDPTFFPFCDELLDRYDEDPRVLMITGTTVGGRWRRGTASYHFARRGANWGWAGWRRTWLGRDRRAPVWSDAAARRRVRRALGRGHYRSWARWMDLTNKRHSDRGVDLLFTILARDGLCAVPSVNLVTNLGFRADATSTVNTGSRSANVPTEPMAFPLRHPATVAPDADYDRRVREARHPSRGWHWPWWTDEISRELTMRRRARA
jgi:hypothetical protein